MPRTWRLAHGRSLELGDRAIVMGILNVTPDSFSDGDAAMTPERAVARAQEMLAQGADIIDVGGESTRPGAEPVSTEEELARVIPVIEQLARLGAIVSVDTYRETTAQMAVRAGAHIVNDVWGLQREPGIARIAAEKGAGIVIMHTGRDRHKLPDVIEDQFAFLRRSLSLAADAGILAEQIVLDPGFGFAKDPGENLEICARLDELGALGYPLLVGTSRKRFLGHVTGRDAADRDAATAATSAILRCKGADIFRVHDVAMNVEALKIADAIRLKAVPGR